MDQEILRQIQLTAVKIAKEIHRICKENDIQYSITAGSVIGYHLYGGIIPWDDDIDIMMTRENYEKFVAVCETQLPSNYSLDNYENQKDKAVLFSKIVDQNTTVIEKNFDGRELVRGAFVDISVFDNVPQNVIHQKYLAFLSKLIQFCREREYEKGKALEGFIKNVGITLVKPISKWIYHFCKKGLTSVSKEKTIGLAEYFFGILKVYKTEIFSAYTEVEFEGEQLMIVADYMQYLETRYGKRIFYKEQRAGDVPHHFIYANLNMPFKEYLARYHVEETK